MSDRVAVVTGAASGIGLGIARRLAADGHGVALLDRDGPGARDAAVELTGQGRRVRDYEVDVADREAVDRVFASVRQDLGPVTILVTSAGIESFDAVLDITPEQWDRILAVNLTGMFIMTKAALAYMLEGPGGSIVNIASTAGLLGSAYSAAYCASKGGVIMLTKALAIEYAGRGVRINAVAPGGVDTPLIGSFQLPEGGDMKHLYRITSRMGFCTPDQVAAAIAFLASDESAYTTGAVLAVDGGITA
jgi:NAD(P)-dependent dehydrogenase (short-subunit alcohol dehydrogenase family)